MFHKNYFLIDHKVLQPSTKPLSQDTLREELNAKRQQVKELRKKKKQTEWTYEQTKTFKEKIKHKGQKIRVDPKTNKVNYYQ